MSTLYSSDSDDMSARNVSWKRYGLSRVIVVMVPFLPASILQPNRGERREGRVPQDISDAKRQMRGDWALWLLTQPEVRALDAPFQKAAVTLTLRCIEPRGRKGDGLFRPLDAGNAIYALKAGLDGLIDAGLIVDDDWQHLEAVTGRIERVHDRASEGVLVEVHEICLGVYSRGSES